MPASVDERPLRLVREGEDPQGPDDSELLLAHLSGDPRAFGELVRRYQKPIYRLALRYARDHDEAEELAQRTFLKAFTHADKLKPGLPFRPFLFRVAANLCKNHIRDRAKLIFGMELDVASPEGEPIEDRQRRARVRALLAKLPLRQRQVVSLRIDGDLPFAEVAAALDITENNAKVCYHHAVQRLKQWVAEEDL